ncbi:phosphomannomutase [Devosia neptuniae]|uniref:phosphomannomutase n=1 Tax=Devosia neptuniae TaxID=191302 RepID=UPI0022AFA2E0|nr:phosphomannomutase [Devosia neptuniae]MCZ4345002.1 phosphomannomutase [Devosia neptuniae]|tara:strand:- start:441 stop:1853 length:1413 start_codon:yes stop_codon:yes gene_type:complete
MTSLKFGTSGLRGLAADLIGTEARRYTTAFLRHLDQIGEAADTLYLGRDLRSSSSTILADCANAASALGIGVIDCGVLPAPALALHAMAAGSPSLMITGSHIPADRNGLKFYRAAREISKEDETGIIRQLGDFRFSDISASTLDNTAAASDRYLNRYNGLLRPDALNGWRVGVYEHSSAGREALAKIFASYGAEIVKLGRVDDFVAVDTEAFTDAVFAPLKGWLEQHRLDAIISADGDADRPLLMDNQGEFVRGDVLGLLASQFFKADTVVTPVTSNTAIEASALFPTVIRTKVGSPFVIEGMEKALANGGHRVFGFEANGGTLLGNDLATDGETQLTALMTRDAILPLIGVFALAAEQSCSISDLVKRLPLRVALSGRLENFSSQKSSALLEKLMVPQSATAFFAARGSIVRMEAIDGLQFFLSDDTMVHYRASGNAPELRCYVEASTSAQADSALQWGLDAARIGIAQ